MKKLLNRFIQKTKPKFLKILDTFIYRVVPVVLIGIAVGGLATYANTFPTTMNVWEAGDVIEESWANSLETRIGETGTTTRTTITYQLNQLMGTTTLPNLASIGTITSGVWNGTAIGASYLSSAGAAGQIQFNSGGVFYSSSYFNWDNTNGRLGIGTTTPRASFSIDTPTGTSTPALMIGTQGEAPLLYLSNVTGSRGFFGLGTNTPATLLSVQGGALIGATTTTHGLHATSTIQLGTSPTANWLRANSTSTLANGLDLTGGGLRVIGATRLDSLEVTGAGTTTLANGIVLRDGCIFKVATGACISEVPSGLTGILEEAGGVISTVTIGSSLDYTGTTLSVGTVSIADGGTNATTQTSNGVNYFDGTSITSGTGLTFTGTNLGVGTTSPGTIFSAAGIGLFNSLNTSGTATSTMVNGGLEIRAGGLRIIGGLRTDALNITGSATTTINGGLELASGGCISIADGGCLGGKEWKGYNVASTTQRAGTMPRLATTTILISNAPISFTLEGVYTKATSTAATSKFATLRFDDGSGNKTTVVQCNTTGGYTAFSSNNTWNPFEDFIVEIRTDTDTTIDSNDIGSCTFTPVYKPTSN